MENNKARRVYFAHPINTYDTILETFFFDYMSRFGDTVEIVNPNSPEHKAGYEKEGMDYFKKVVQSCDTLMAFGFGDNSIGAGIEKEMIWMREVGGKVIFMPFFTEWQELFGSPRSQFEILGVADTRAKLKEKSKEVKPVPQYIWKAIAENDIWDVR